MSGFVRICPDLSVVRICPDLGCFCPDCPYLSGFVRMDMKKAVLLITRAREYNSIKNKEKETTLKGLP